MLTLVGDGVLLVIEVFKFTELFKLVFIVILFVKKIDCIKIIGNWIYTAEVKDFYVNYISIICLIEMKKYTKIIFI